MQSIYALYPSNRAQPVRTRDKKKFERCPKSTHNNGNKSQLPFTILCLCLFGIFIPSLRSISALYLSWTILSYRKTWALVKNNYWSLKLGAFGWNYRLKLGALDETFLRSLFFESFICLFVPLHRTWDNFLSARVEGLSISLPRSHPRNLVCWEISLFSWRWRICFSFFLIYIISFFFSHACWRSEGK